MSDISGTVASGKQPPGSGGRLHLILDAGGAVPALGQAEESGRPWERSIPLMFPSQFSVSRQRRPSATPYQIR